MPKGHGKRRNNVTAAEAITMATLRETGMTVSAIARDTKRSRQAVTDALREAKELLGSSVKYYAEQHLKATGIAAADGNSKPAEWALERLKVVDPVKDVDNKGFSVHIGVMLPGLGTRAVEVSELGTEGQVLEGSLLEGE